MMTGLKGSSILSMPILVLPFKNLWNACNLFHCLQSDWISSLPVIYPPVGESTVVVILTCRLGILDRAVFTLRQPLF